MERKDSHAAMDARNQEATGITQSGRKHIDYHPAKIVDEPRIRTPIKLEENRRDMTAKGMRRSTLIKEQQKAATAMTEEAAVEATSGATPAPAGTIQGGTQEPAHHQVGEEIRNQTTITAVIASAARKSKRQC